MTATMPMSDRAALLRTVLEWPESDAPRLVFADYLDENGENERAEFIRKSINDHPTTFLTPSLRMPVRWDIPDGTYLWKRGFVEEIRLPCAAFMQHAREIFASHPVTRVNFGSVPRIVASGPGAAGNPSMFRWTPAPYLNYPRWRPSDIPAPWYQDLIDESVLRGVTPSWSSCESAIDWLSDKAVAYGRSLAGLRPLDRPIRPA